MMTGDQRDLWGPLVEEMKDWLRLRGWQQRVRAISLSVRWQHRFDIDNYSLGDIGDPKLHKARRETSVSYHRLIVCDLYCGFSSPNVTRGVNTNKMEAEKLNIEIKRKLKEIGPRRNREEGPRHSSGLWMRCSSNVPQRNACTGKRNFYGVLRRLASWREECKNEGDTSRGVAALILDFSKRFCVEVCFRNVKAQARATRRGSPRPERTIGIMFVVKLLFGALDKRTVRGSSKDVDELSTIKCGTSLVWRCQYF